jgi:hypothetical protein
MGALSSAMAHMAANAAAPTSGRGRMALGVGTQDGEEALSIGMGVRIGTRLSLTLGAAFGAGEKSAGAGVGLDF